MSRRAQGGFTLTELMVVVVILGILVAFSVNAFKSQPVSDGARKVTAMISEARRRAIADGPVRDDVRAASGISARSRLVFEPNGILRVWVLVEDPRPANTYRWVNVSSSALPKGAEIYALGSTAAMDPGGAIPAPIAYNGTNPATATRKNFYPNGTCDAMTVYLRATGSSDTNKRYRVFAMPLNAIPASFKGW